MLSLSKTSNSESASPQEESFKIITFGCRLNTYESEVMRRYATEAHLKNAIIIHTCAVTNEAERQARQAIRRARRDYPQSTLIVTGCSSQMNPETYNRMPEVDQIWGNHEKMQKETFDLSKNPRLHVQNINQVKEISSSLINRFSGHSRAFIQIQNGCDHSCTFCATTVARGPSRSVPMGDIAHQIQTWVQQGCQEVVLTGVDITGYGSDLPGLPTLGQMIRRVLARVPDLKRLRLSSLDPAEIDPDLYHLIGTEPRLMPHFHLSVQAGDDLILKRMKRRHLRKDVIECCFKVRTLRPDAVFGADLITGFPTETEDMFQKSLDIVQECDLTYLHVFPYSPRPGTAAARMPQTPSQIGKERAAILRQLGDRQLTNSLHRWVGKTANVLVEANGTGHTEHYAPVTFLSPFDPSSGVPERGKVVQAQIKGVKGHSLQAQMINRMEEKACHHDQPLGQTEILKA